MFINCGMDGIENDIYVYSNGRWVYGIKMQKINILIAFGIYLIIIIKNENLN